MSSTGTGAIPLSAPCSAMPSTRCSRAATRSSSCRPAAASRCASSCRRSWTPAVPSGAAPLALVISPLIALMKDQVDGLVAQGVAAACLHSGQTSAERQAALDQVRSGACRLLYVAPERAVGDGERRLRRARRPAGASLRRHRRGALHQPVGPRLPAGVSPAPRAARPLRRASRSTRSRPRRRREYGPTSCRSSALRQPVELVGPFDRPNLVYRVVPRADGRKQIQQVLVAAPERGRHHLLPLAAGSRGDGGVAPGRGRARAALPRRSRRRGAPPEPGRLPQRRRRRHGGDRRVRHGHRPIERAVRDSRRRAAFARALPAGGRTRRTRRAAVRVRADQLAGRLRALAQPARVHRRMERAGPAADARHGALRRRDDVPASRAGGILRPAARARAVRRVRLVPRRAGARRASQPSSRRRSCRRSRGPDSAGASATSSRCCAASPARPSRRGDTISCRCSACCGTCPRRNCEATSIS